jgi:hypothetical protein
MAVVYRFRTWDIINDQFHTSGRWATKEAIAGVHGEAISEGVEIDEHYLGREVDGMTERGFDASNPPHGRFQNKVK